MVKIGGWSDDEQNRIFELMKEHYTSWSSISKSLNGRTENSIKNYFYSTVRRIQSCKVIDYFDLMKQQKDLPPFESIDKFHSNYQLDSLNKLGVIMCKWLFLNEASKKEHQSLFDYLLNVIADEKKRPKPKQIKQEEVFETTPLSENPIQGQGYYIQNLLPELFSGKNYQGVHPLLPLALYGGFGRLKSRDFFQSVINEQPQTSSYPNLLNQVPTQQSKIIMDNPSDISVPIPQVKYSLNENLESHLIGELPNRLSEILQSDKLQHSLFNLLIANLSKSMHSTAANNKPIPPNGNWLSRSDQFKDNHEVTKDFCASGTGNASSNPFRGSQIPRNTGFSPVILANSEKRLTGNFSQMIKESCKQENLDPTFKYSPEAKGLAEARKSTQPHLKCSKCLSTSKVCRCLP